MNKDLTCHQVSALISFYLEGKLNPRLREYVNIHLAKCPACKKKIEELQKILSRYKVNKNSAKENSVSEQLAPEFIHKLSEYVDNELNSSENIKIKKMTISNPTARKELETMYKFKKVIRCAYEKTKNDSKYDYSKSVLSKIQDNSEYTTTYFYKLAAIFIALISAIVTGFIYLYF